MAKSHGAAIIILALAILLSTGPVTSAISFPVDWTINRGLIADVPCQPDKNMAPLVHAIDENDDGKTIHAAKGDILFLQLKESGPDRSWYFSGEGGLRVVSDAPPEKYPGLHDFKVKVLRSGELRFTKVDRRDGFPIDKFTVSVVIRKDKTGNDTRMAHPLRAFD